MASLAEQIGDDPMLLPLLDRLEAQCQQLGAPKSAANQHRDHRVISELALECRRCYAVEQSSALLGGQPVPETNSDSAHAFHATDACRQFWTQEASVGRLVRHTTDRSEP